jgi:hypothetical protein
VLSQWAQNTNFDEKEIFGQYSKLPGLSENDAAAFRGIAILSNCGVLIGQSYKIIRINPWWIRDQYRMD